MLTINQLLSKKRIKKIQYTKNKFLLQNKPQIKGIWKKLFTMAPKKPNSALRKMAKILIKNKIEINAHIPGEGYAFQEHNIVLIQGSHVKDLPGIHYRVIRGAEECYGVKTRTNSRSKYGVKKN
uniref:30S ribosomal protein S12 n=1 Tax=Nephromyces sp. ex Molgula occidentalis TaxID=2544991 RepID=A0A5C1H8R9_9APIC|nr:30S ribosomal protein S12 [Nephromyces sp. ex Molgula occidentalis]